MCLLNADILAGNAVTADSGKQGRRRAESLPPDFPEGRQRGRRCLFHNSIIGIFMVDQDRIETKFSILSLIIYGSTLLLNGSKHW